MTDYENYQSPFSWRYGSPEMRRIWSEASKRRLWRHIWVTLAEAQVAYGLVRSEQVAELRENKDRIDMTRAAQIEAEIHHDLMAELKVFAEQCPYAGGVLHLGATSTDIEDNADPLRMRQSLDLLLSKLNSLLLLFADQIEHWADLTLIAFTHLQPAEPTTLGYRLAVYAQDLLMDWENLRRERRHLRGKGFKGAVGTSASYAELFGVDYLAEFETRLSTSLGLAFFPVDTQTYPRKQDYQMISALAGIGASLYKFAFDLRVLQSPPIGELSEPFGLKQVGSSAMPFKRNPIQAEKIDSLARSLAQMPRVAWDNAAHSLLERTLDDSANRRSLLPEAFLIADELLATATRLLEGMQVYGVAITRNLARYAPFAATERVLMELVRAGADRQEMHERLRRATMTAWKEMQTSDSNPLFDDLSGDPLIQELLGESKLQSLMDANQHIGDAPQRARLLANTIRETVSSQVSG
jgi:adenylosuccinate lyase